MQAVHGTTGRKQQLLHAFPKSLPSKNMAYSLFSIRPIAMADMSDTNPFRFQDLPLELQIRVLDSVIGRITRTNFLLLNNAHYSSLAPSHYQKAVFRFDSSRQLLQFLKSATGLCMRSVRRVRYSFGPEARPSLNFNPKKDARYNALYVQVFIEDLTMDPNLSALQHLEIGFRCDEHFHRVNDGAHDSDNESEPLTLRRILAGRSIAMQSACESEKVLPAHFSGWKLGKTLRIQAWKWATSQRGHERMKRLYEVKDDDVFDEAFVHRVVLVLTKS